MFRSNVKFAAIAVLAVGFAGSEVGLLGHRTNATTAAPAPAKQDSDIQRWREKLDTFVDYPGIDDARATLTDALDHVSKRYGINFDIIDPAFHALDPKIDVPRICVAEKPIPARRARLKTILQTILARLPAKLTVLYIIRNDHIDITTETAVRAELGIPANRPMLPLVWETLTNTPINVAFQRLAHQSGYNVVVDPRIANTTQTPATLELNNVPVDTAVRLLANIAGQSVVRLDNVLFVTTADNAEKLLEEQAKINAEKAAK